MKKKRFDWKRGWEREKEYSASPMPHRRRSWSRSKRTRCLQGGPQKVIEWARRTGKRHASEHTLRGVIDCPDDGTVNAVMTTLNLRGLATKERKIGNWGEWTPTVWSIVLPEWCAKEER